MASSLSGAPDRGGAPTRHDANPAEKEVQGLAASETRSSDPALMQRAHAFVGTTLRGKYHLEGVIGVGGIGAVYAATHRNSKRFAVKLLHAHLSLNDDIRSRFLREGYAANRVGHSGTVAVLDDDVTEDGGAFLVMELLEGIPVDVLAERCGGRLSIAVAVTIGDQLLEVLAAAHSNNIIHRDIKPANLFVTTDGRLKVLDFGIARARDMLGGSGMSTNTGTLLGTPAFMAPEQARAQSSEIGARTDLWAAAATLFTMITGELVHPGDNPTLMLVHAATRVARPMESVPLGAPARIAAVVDRGLAFAKEDRWPSAVAMRAALRAAYQWEFGAFPLSISVNNEPVALSPSLTPAPIESSALRAPKKGPRRWPLVALVALLLAVAWASRRLATGTAPSQNALGGRSAFASAAALAPVAPAAPSLSRSEPSREGPRTPDSLPSQPAVPADSASQKPRGDAGALHAAAVQVPAALQARPAPARFSPPPNCVPPYHFDSQGNQVFNKECF
jgi:eukaryotic-like serine/threonine-protein kinase